MMYFLSAQWKYVIVSLCAHSNIIPFYPRLLLQGLGDKCVTNRTRQCDVTAWSWMEHWVSNKKNDFWCKLHCVGFLFNFCALTVSETDIKRSFSAEWKYFIASQCAHSNIIPFYWTITFCWIFMNYFLLYFNGICYCVLLCTQKYHPFFIEL